MWDWGKHGIKSFQEDLLFIIIWDISQISATNPSSISRSSDSRSELEQSNRYPSSNSVIGRRGLDRLDLLLLAIEALDLNGSQSMIWTSRNIGLQDQFPSNVDLWKCRCHSPLRKTTRRGLLTNRQSEALIILICTMSQRLYP